MAGSEVASRRRRGFSSQVSQREERKGGRCDSKSRYINIQAVNLQHVRVGILRPNYQAGVSTLLRGRGVALRGLPERRGRAANSSISKWYKRRAGLAVKLCTYSDLSRAETNKPVSPGFSRKTRNWNAKRGQEGEGTGRRARGGRRGSSGQTYQLEPSPALGRKSRLAGICETQYGGLT